MHLSFRNKTFDRSNLFRHLLIFKFQIVINRKSFQYSTEPYLECLVLISKELKRLYNRVELAHNQLLDSSLLSPTFITNKEDVNQYLQNEDYQTNLITKIFLWRKLYKAMSTCII